jgi:hypothetical protein
MTPVPGPGRKRGESSRSSGPDAEETEVEEGEGGAAAFEGSPPSSGFSVGKENEEEGVAILSFLAGGGGIVADGWTGKREVGLAEQARGCWRSGGQGEVALVGFVLRIRGLRIQYAELYMLKGRVLLYRPYRERPSLRGQVGR